MGDLPNAVREATSSDSPGAVYVREGGGAGRGNAIAHCDLNALRHNLKLIREVVEPHQQVMPCLKASAYGHGLPRVAACLQDEGVEWLCLGSSVDALALRRAGIRCRILLFPTICNGSDEHLAQAGITIAVSSFEQAEVLSRRVDRPVSVFLKVDSGLGRLGAPINQAPAIARRIVSELPSIDLEGVFTHVPFTERSQLNWVEERLTEFRKSVSGIGEQLNLPLITQCLASNALIWGIKAPETNAVCPGELLFGITSAIGESNAASPLRHIKPVLKEIETLVGAIHSLPAGTRFGLGGSLVAARETRLAVLPIGYSDLLMVPRTGQSVAIMERIAPVVMVSLEHTVVDVTEIHGVYDGCPAKLIAQDSALGLTLTRMAKTQQRSTLEVLVSLTGNVVYLYESD